MKRIERLILVLVVLLFTSSCFFKGGNKMVIDNGTEKTEIRYSGQIKFNTDETTIEKISKFGYLEYQKDDLKLFAGNTKAGELKFDIMNHNQRVNPESEEGKKLIATVIQDLISVGFDAPGRIQRIEQKGGLRAVLNESDRIQSDFTKSSYLEYLLKSDSVKKSYLVEIAQKIEKQVGSDFEKSKLLKQFPEKLLQDSAVSKSYFSAVGTIGSDFEKANALKSRINESLTREQAEAIISTANSLGSDFEKANVLKMLIDHSVFNEIDNLKMTQSIDNIGSEFDKCNLLKAAIDKSALNGEDFANLLSSSSKIGSDYEKANLLKKFLEKELHNDQQWSDLIACITQIGSEYDRSNILLQIAAKMPKNDVLKEKYMNAAKTINSENDFGRVVKAIN